VRNRGTLGGSIALADPAADYPVALVAIDAVIELVSATGRRSVPAREFFRGMFDTVLTRSEIVAAVRMPRSPEGRRHRLRKLSLVAGDFAILSVAAIAGDDVGRRDRWLCDDPAGSPASSPLAMCASRRRASSRGSRSAGRPARIGGGIAAARRPSSRPVAPSMRRWARHRSDTTRVAR
jgi:hypothetical protein